MQEFLKLNPVYPGIKGYSVPKYNAEIDNKFRTTDKNSRMSRDEKQSFYNYTIGKKKGVPAANLYNIRVERAVPKKIYNHDRITVFAECSKRAKAEGIKACPCSYDPKPIQHKPGSKLKCHLKVTDERVTPAMESLNASTLVPGRKYEI